YRIYWDTDSGSASPYAFDSVANPGQVAFAGTTATISGLTSGTTYYVTLTARSTFTDPSSLVQTTYESILYPTQVSGDPSFVYPTEAQGVTAGGGCTPTAEITGLTVDYATAGQLEFCWDVSTDPCVAGYRLLGAASPESSGGFATVADTGPVNCWTGSPPDGFFLVVGRGGSGGTGPWGHFGQ
ncbi:MAG TPA: hypothetical protein VFP98_02295, partial [Candidatus Polarisedimenticolia bacterium]|nr:hypothetical protein [Candidatus Polarisedimenticolia bacterium]